eukprot:gene23408-30682_t
MAPGAKLVMINVCSEAGALDGGGLDIFTATDSFMYDINYQAARGSFMYDINYQAGMCVAESVAESVAMAQVLSS